MAIKQSCVTGCICGDFRRADYLSTIVDGVGFAECAAERAKIGHHAVLPKERPSDCFSLEGRKADHLAAIINGGGLAVHASERTKIGNGKPWWPFNPLAFVLVVKAL